MAPLMDLPKLLWLEAPLKLPQFIRRYEVLAHLLLTADTESTQIVMSHPLPTKTRLIGDVLLKQWKPTVTRHCYLIAYAHSAGPCCCPIGLGSLESWVSRRSGARSNVFYDSVRGGNYSNNTAATTTAATTTTTTTNNQQQQ